ncbi:MAG: SDR family NAD(P)-dependent oxidoreductase [Alphaproteobacteria bacterium]
MTMQTDVNIQPLERAVAVLTGATSGIGFESAAQLAAAGVPAIVVNGRDPAKGDAALAALSERAPGTEFRFRAADVTDGAQAAALIDFTVAEFGRIDVLVNCAGGDHAPKLFHDTASDEIAAVMSHVMMGALYCSRAALPTMMAQRGGSIVNIASDAAKVPTPGETVIGAAMAAILMFTRTLAMEAKRSGVRVNCLTPSIVRGTKSYDMLMAQPFSGKLFEKAMAAAHLGVVTPADIASMVVYLASPAAARVTGQGISINGGISAG